MATVQRISRGNYGNHGKAGRSGGRRKGAGRKPTCLCGECVKCKAREARVRRQSGVYLKQRWKWSNKNKSAFELPLRKQKFNWDRTNNEKW